METPDGVEIVQEYTGVGVESVYDKIVRLVERKRFTITEKHLRPYEVGELTAYEGSISAYRKGVMTGIYERGQRDVIDASIEGRADGTVVLRLNIDAKNTHLIDQMAKDLNAFVGDSKDSHHVTEGRVDDACRRLCKR